MLHQRLLSQPIAWILVIFLTTRTQVDAVIPRATARALLLGKTIWVYGGFPNSSVRAFNTAATLDVSVPWSVANPPWTERADDLSVAPHSQIGTMFPTVDQTGFYLSDQNGGFNETYGMAKFDAVNYKWTTLPVTTFSTLPPSGHAGWDNSGNAWVWMGYLSSLVTNNTQVENRDVFKFSQYTQSWTLIPNQLPNLLFRRLHRIVWLSSGLLIPIGGASSFDPNIFAPMDDLVTYNTITGKWLAVTATGTIPTARHSHSATLAPDGYSIILYAGQDEVGNVLGDVAVLDTRKFIWSTSNISGTAPRPRIKHTAVLVGDALIIMGGGVDPNLTVSTNVISETIVLNTTTWSWLTTYTPPKIWPNVTTSTPPNIRPSVVTSGNPLPVAVTTIATTTVIPTSSDGLGVGVTAGVVVIAFVAISIAVLILFIRRRMRRLAIPPVKREDEEKGDEFGEGQGPATWKLDDEWPKKLKLDDLAPEVETAVTVNEDVKKQVIVEEDIIDARNYENWGMDILDVVFQKM